MDSSTVTELIILILLVGLSAFFSSAETALSSISEIKIRTLVENGDKGANLLQKIEEDYSKMISAILIGNNIVNISASSLATTITIRLFGNVYVGLATGLLTLVILLFGEIVPKNAAKMKYEKMALVYAPIIRAVMVILTPVIWVVDKIAHALLWMFGIKPEDGTTITEAELRTIVDASHEEGVIESEEKEIINNVFDFSDSVAKEIMLPIIDMVSVEDTATYDEVMALFKNYMYTRLPVYKNEKDNIIGIINIKDFIFVEDREGFKISDICRDVYFTHEYKKTSDLLLELRQTTNQLAFVLSEYGLCVGMVTLEDLLEEIVGEIRDEYDEEELEKIKKVERNVYIIAGTVKLDDINDALGTELTSENYDSLGGLILERIDRIPEVGDKIELDEGIRMRVNEVYQNRITKVRVILPESDSSMQL